MSADGWIGKTWLANYSITARVPYALNFPAYQQISDLPRDTLLQDSSQQPFFVSPRRFRAGVVEDLEGADVFGLAAASFVHGGIYPRWALRQDPIETMNEIGQSLLYKAIGGPVLGYAGLPRNTTADERALYDEHGPLWYRGTHTNSQSSLHKADRILNRLRYRGRRAGTL